MTLRPVWVGSHPVRPVDRPVPAEGTPPAEVFKRLRQAEREKGSKQLAAVPRSFETVVLRLLAPAKKDRFQTARELLDELTQLGKAEGLQG